MHSVSLTDIISVVASVATLVTTYFWLRERVRAKPLYSILKGVHSSAKAYSGLYASIVSDYRTDPRQAIPKEEVVLLLKQAYGNWVAYAGSVEGAVNAVDDREATSRDSHAHDTAASRSVRS